MRVLVTGANGHIGANLVRALLARGDKVRALIHRGTAALDGLEIDMVRGDVRDPGSIAAAMVGVDSVFHLAAFISIDGPHNGLVHQINVDGPRNVAEAALAAVDRDRNHRHRAPPSLSSPMWLARSVAPLALLYSRLMRRPPLFTPESLTALAANPDIGNDKARRELDYAPRPIHETVEAIYRWFAEAGRLEPNDRLRALAN